MKSHYYERYPYKAELHCHTNPASGCSHLSAVELVDLYKALKVDTIVLTNHYYNHPYGDAATLRPKEETVQEYLQCYHDLKVHGDAAGIHCILGMEIRFAENENDYLLYGISEEDVAPLFDSLEGNLENFHRNYKGADQLLYQAHPFRNKMIPADPQHLDGIEVFNTHPGANSRIILAGNYARAHNLPMIGGSDCHDHSHAGGCLMRTKERIETAKQLVSVLRSGDYILDIGGSIILP